MTKVITYQFKLLKDLHKEGSPFCLKPRVAVLHFWGKLRSWSLSGHFHETYMHDLIHVNEALAGLPFAVDFINFDDIREGALEKYDVVINAGYAGSAWSGGDVWKEEEVVSRLTAWVYAGGVFLGVNEPSAAAGYDTAFRMAHVLGVDEDTGAKICHGKWKVQQTEKEELQKLMPEGAHVKAREGRYLVDDKAEVLLEENGVPALVLHPFGKGMGIYLASFEKGAANNRMLLNLILAGCGESIEQNYLTDNIHTECAWYPASGKLVVINNSGEAQSCTIATEKGRAACTLKPYGVEFI